MHPLNISFPNHGSAARLVAIIACGAGLLFGLGLTQASAQGEIEAAELAKRKAQVEEARVLVAKGDEAMQKQRPDVALEAYAGARELLPDAPALKEMREAVTERFSIAAMSQSAALANRGDLKGANEVIDRVLQKGVDPENSSALKMKRMLNNPVRMNPALTPKHHENVQKVLDLIEKANGAVMLGRYDFAAKRYEDILRIDPYNVLARRGLREVIRLKGESKIAAFDHVRADMMLEVDEAWELQVRDPEEDVVLANNDLSPAELGQATLEAKLRQIIIPSLALDQVNLTDAIEFLRVTSMREDLTTEDQAKRGINFNINLGPSDSNMAKEILNKRFDLKLKNVPIAQALKYITRLTGTAYELDPYAVTIIPASQVSDEVYMRQYQVPADFISALSMDAGGDGLDNSNPFVDSAPGQGLLTERMPVQELLKRKGVSFGEGASASYNAPANTLLMVNTAENHNIIEQIIELIKGEDPVIVSVQVTIIKAEQQTLEELGFDWLLFPMNASNNPTVSLGGGTTGNSPGRTIADFVSTTGLVVGSADQTAPNVITNGLRSGDRAFVSDNIDSIINNPTRSSQASRVAPGILSLTGIFDEGGGQMIMRGLSQKTGVDTMARPSIITRSGESSKIVLAREFIYPTEYDPPELQQGGGGLGAGGAGAGPAFPVVPANPTAFETRDVGITMEVLPLAGPNKQYISVTLNPEIVEFDGFVNYGSPITAAVPDALGNPTRVLLTNNEILMPVFSTKRTTTQLTVADGATVVYGGLLSQNIQSVEDKVPVLGDLPILGRMFQSSSNLPITTAIVFLVKVDLMDPTGRTYRDLGAAR